MSTEYKLTAVFDTAEQAKQLAQMIVALQPRDFTFVTVVDGRDLWVEMGRGYGAADVRL